MQYDLELDGVAKKIQTEGASFVCLQLPDGLKPRAKEIADALKAKTGANIVIWLGTCFGACDLPLEVERLGRLRFGEVHV